MVLWNMPDRVKSGTSEKLTAVTDERLEVENDGSGWLLLKCKTWSKRNQVGQVIGSRAQFPTVHLFACNFHNNQDLTLSSAVVHCSKEFVPGLTHVAVSQVRRAKDVQILRFKLNQLLQPHRSKPQ